MSAADAELAASLEDAGRFFEAAIAWQRAGDDERALQDLVRLGPAHPRYRDGCVLAVRLLGEGGPTLAFENLLGAFVRSGPRDDAEAEVFRDLADAYERSGFQGNAGEVLRKLVASRPEDAVAAARLARLRPLPPDLPDLPDLPREPPPAPRHELPRPSEAEERSGPAFHVGALIVDRYRLDERIGTGGMSVVFRTADLVLGDMVALKVLTQGVYDRETDERLRRELILSRRVQHENVVRLFDIGLAHGFRFITMELLTGVDLRSRLRHGALPLHEALGYLVQAARGLHAAHRQGIVHRDVKPENCFVSRDGTLKLMDFGLAKSNETSAVTNSGIVAGTPAYMAPEQVMAFRTVGPAADIYALGVVAYELLTGSVPFDHPDPIPLMLMHANDPVPPPRGRNPELPLELERLVLTCLAKSVDARVADAAELARRFEAIRDSR